MFETEELAKDGKRIPVEVNARIFEFQNKPCVLAVVRDISERNKLQAQLNQSQKMESSDGWRAVWRTISIICWE